jgi:hypothetical protein
MTDRRITILIPRRAVSQVIDPERGRGYFRSMYVYPRHRRRGYCMEIMKFALGYTGEFLEMDIMRTAEAAQRNAARLGYVKVGPSARWDDCELWRHGAGPARLPAGRLRVSSKVTYERRGGVTEVIYLK